MLPDLFDSSFFLSKSLNVVGLHTRVLCLVAFSANGNGAQSVCIFKQSNRVSSESIRIICEMLIAHTHRHLHTAGMGKLATHLSVSYASFVHNTVCRIMYERSTERCVANFPVRAVSKCYMILVRLAT